MELFEIASSFLEDRDSCAWSMIYEKVDFEKMAAVNDGSEALVQTINPILKHIGCPYQIDSLDSKTFNYLIQY